MPYKKGRQARASRLVRRCLRCPRLIIFLSDPSEPSIKKPCLLADEEGRMIWDGNPYWRKGTDKVHIDAAFRGDACRDETILL